MRVGDSGPSDHLSVVLAGIGAGTGPGTGAVVAATPVAAGTGAGPAAVGSSVGPGGETPAASSVRHRVQEPSGASGGRSIPQFGQRPESAIGGSSPGGDGS